MTAKDLKPISDPAKPDITHLRKVTAIYIARGCEYGTAKYGTRANYLRASADDNEAFARVRNYLRATIGHCMDVLDAMESADAGKTSMAMACAVPDHESGLPPIAHALCSLQMALAVGVDGGLFKPDPGYKSPTKNIPGASER